MRSRMTWKRFAVLVAVYFAAALAVMAAAPFVGAESVGIRSAWRQIFSGRWGAEADILVMQRFPRVLLGFLAGGTLALVGASFQVVLRNILAEPYTLGITGGSALGAVIAISVPGLAFDLTKGWGLFSSVQVFALAGSMGALLFIYIVARRTAGLSMNTVLLAGVTFGIFCGAMIMLVRYLVSPHLLVAMDRWMMGGVDVVGYRELASFMPILLPALAVLAPLGSLLNHLSLGEEMAAGHGVDVKAVERQVLIAGGVATAAIVSMTGPIGFVGLVVPHIVRRISGNDQRLVLPASFALGGAILVACDTVARTLVAPAEMPVGIITAMLGGPVFIYLLIRQSWRGR